MCSPNAPRRASRRSQKRSYSGSAEYAQGLDLVRELVGVGIAVALGNTEKDEHPRPDRGQLVVIDRHRRAGHALYESPHGGGA
jgi:hypothetical protein